MARKTQSTRQKLTFRLAPTRPRNPVAVPAKKRAAGAHRKSVSSERARALRELEKSFEDDEKD